MDSEWTIRKYTGCDGRDIKEDSPHLMKEQGIGSEEYAEVFLREVFKHDGLLDVIQSDRDTRLTSAYHSSSNPPNDRVQRVLEELLRTNTQFPTLE